MASPRTERIDRIAAYYQTADIPTNQLTLYPYREFAIDDGDEWLSWAERHYADLPQREVDAKIASFEAQQKAIYELLEQPEMWKASFMKALKEQLAEMGAAKFYEELSLNDLSLAYDFYLTKLKIYSAKVAEDEASTDAERRSTKLEAEKVREAARKAIFDKNQGTYNDTFRGSFTVPSVISLGVGATLSAAADASALALMAVKQAASALPQYVPAALPQACATGLTTLAGHVGGADNASLVVAAAASLSTFAAVKTSLYATRRLKRGRAHVELKAAEEQLHQATKRRREQTDRMAEAERKLKFARQALAERIQADETGTSYEEDDEEDEEDDEEDEEEGEEEEEDDNENDGVSREEDSDDENGEEEVQPARLDCPSDADARSDDTEAVEDAGLQ